MSKWMEKVFFLKKTNNEGISWGIFFFRESVLPPAAVPDFALGCGSGACCPVVVVTVMLSSYL